MLATQEMRSKDATPRARIPFPTNPFLNSQLRQKKKAGKAASTGNVRRTSGTPEPRQARPAVAKDYLVRKNPMKGSLGEAFRRRGGEFRVIVNEPTVHKVSGELAHRRLCRFSRRLLGTNPEVVNIAGHLRRSKVIVTIRIEEVENPNRT